MQAIGGNTEQAINHIAIDICYNYFSEETYTETDDEGDESEHTRIVRHVAKLASYKITESFKTKVKQSLRFDFSIELPFYSPLSLGNCKVWLDTDLDIDRALDKSDKDTLAVLPAPRQQLLLNAMHELGFALVEVECEEGRQLGQPFVQEFEFKAQQGEFRNRVDEVEILMVNYPERLEVLIEIDRRARGLGGFFAEISGRDESRLWLDIETLEQSQVTELLENTIEQYC